jgi:hypothetical protein
MWEILLNTLLKELENNPQLVENLVKFAIKQINDALAKANASKV